MHEYMNKPYYLLNLAMTRNQWRHSQHCHTTSEVGIQDGGRQNRKYLYFSVWRSYTNAISNHNTTFSGSGNSGAPLQTLIATPQQKSEFKMAVVKTGSTYISACGGAILPLDSWTSKT